MKKNIIRLYGLLLIGGILLAGYPRNTTLNHNSFTESGVSYQFIRTYPFKANPNEVSVASNGDPVVEYNINDNDIELQFSYKFYRTYKDRFVQQYIHREYIEGIPFLSVYPGRKLGKIPKQLFDTLGYTGCELTGRNNPLGFLTGLNKDSKIFTYDLSNKNLGTFVGSCPFYSEMLDVPNFIVDKNRPNEVFVIIIEDGRGGATDENWEKTLKR